MKWIAVLACPIALSGCGSADSGQESNRTTSLQVADQLLVKSESWQNCDATEATFRDKTINFDNQNCKGWSIEKCGKIATFVSKGIQLDDVNVLDLASGQTTNIRTMIEREKPGTEVVKLRFGDGVCVGDGMKFDVSYEIPASGGTGALEEARREFDFSR